MEQIELTIAGQSPLLMHVYPMIEIPGLDKMKPRIRRIIFAPLQERTIN